MSVLSAARIVLDDSPEPLCAEAIYRRMVERGLWSNPHEHPEATVAAAISSEIGRHAGESRFRQTSDRAFATRERRSR
jgi:HB1/ASXL restriction endonuclease-like protein with HTH domain